MCSASTAEYCDSNKGVAMLCVGTTISSLAFVDDMLDVNNMEGEDAQKAHENSFTFSFNKKMSHKGKKCKSLLVNKKKKDRLPELFICDEAIENVSAVQ